MNKIIRVGCAGWSLRKEHFHLFPDAGSHLERYAQRFNCVEINSSFYRAHRLATYRRWAEATPPDFRFSVKLPKRITHVNRLVGSADLISLFAAEVAGLQSKLGVVLVQLPPSLAFDMDVASEFFTQLSEALRCPIVVEPRHGSWFDERVDSYLNAWRIGRVAADPAVTPAAAEPIPSRGLIYFRWHGSPRVYYSSYEEVALVSLAQRLHSGGDTLNEAWCIFDNTATGAATSNALALQECVATKNGD